MNRDQINHEYYTKKELLEKFWSTVPSHIDTISLDEFCNWWEEYSNSTEQKFWGKYGIRVEHKYEDMKRISGDTLKEFTEAFDKYIERRKKEFEAFKYLHDEEKRKEDNIIYNENMKKIKEALDKAVSQMVENINTMMPLLITSSMIRAITQGSYPSRIRNGYRQIQMDDGNWYYEHRVIAEHHYGPIPDGYEVHHKDKNPLNNNPSNLETLPIGQHRKLHGKD